MPCLAAGLLLSARGCWIRNGRKPVGGRYLALPAVWFSVMRRGNRVQTSVSLHGSTRVLWESNSWLLCTRASAGAPVAGGRGGTSLSAVARRPLARRPLHSHRPFSMTAAAPEGSQSGKGRAWWEARASLERRGTGNADGECLTGSLSGLRPLSAAGDTKPHGHAGTKPLVLGLTAFIFWAFAYPSYFRKKRKTGCHGISKCLFC